MPSRTRCGSNTRRSSATASSCSSTAPTSRSSATSPTRIGRSPSSSASSSAWSLSINRALTNVPRERVRVHVCWGNYEGPHDLDAVGRDPAGHPKSQGRRLHVPVRQPPSRPRISLALESGVLDDDQVLVGIDTLTNFVEHPGGGGRPIERGAGAWRSAPRAGRHRLRFDTSAGMGRVAEDVVWAKPAPGWRAPCFGTPVPGRGRNPHLLVV